MDLSLIHDSIFERVWIPLTGLNLLHVIVFKCLRSEVIVPFVDIGGIVDHHCFNFLFII